MEVEDQSKLGGRLLERVTPARKGRSSGEDGAEEPSPVDNRTEIVDFVPYRVRDERQLATMKKERNASISQLARMDQIQSDLDEGSKILS